MSNRQWFYAVSGSKEGPIPEQDLVKLFQSGYLDTKTLVWTSNMVEWMEARLVEGLLTKDIPPELPPMKQQVPPLRISPYAGFWKRLGAAIIDMVVLLIGGLIVGAAFGLAFGESFETAEDATIFANILGLILGWLYFAAMESSPKQGTFGKQALGIKVTDLDGKPITFGRATGRHFGKNISSLILFIGFIMVSFTEKKQGLHDMMAGCLVVNSSR